MKSSEQASFLQGLAYAIGWIIRSHGFESVGIELLKISGYTYADLLKVGCDETDLEPIAKALGLHVDGMELEDNG